jgi:hypothetical protein
MASYGGYKSTLAKRNATNPGRVEVSPRSGTTFIRRTVTKDNTVQAMARENAKRDTHRVYTQAMSAQGVQPVDYSEFNAMVDKRYAGLRDRIKGITLVPELEEKTGLPWGLIAIGAGVVGLWFILRK